METCLCLALYELFFLGKSEYAIVNEYVELAKRQVGQAKAHALNAILHTILKDKERVKGTCRISGTNQNADSRQSNPR